MTSKVQLVARIVLALVYFVFGLMGLAFAFGLMKMPDQPMPEAAKAFMTGIMATGYFFPLLKLTEVIFGFLLFFTRFAPLALVVLAPVTLNIILYHVFLTPSAGEMLLPLVMGLAQVIAMSAYWKLYQPLFSARK